MYGAFGAEEAERWQEIQDEIDELRERMEEETGERRYRHSYPDKRLASPITLGLLTRLQDLILRVEQRAVEDSRGGRYVVNFRTSARRVLEGNRLLSYSGIANSLDDALVVREALGIFPRIIDVREYARCFNYLPANSTDTAQRDADTASRIFASEVDAYLHYLRPLLSEKDCAQYRSDLTSRVLLDADCVNAFATADYYDSLVEFYRQKSHLPAKKMLSRLGTDLFVCRGFLAVDISAMLGANHKEWRIMTYEQLQMIQDCTRSRANVYVAIAASLHCGSSLIKEHIAYTFRWQDKVIERYGNPGYNLVKAPESIFKSRLTDMSNGNVLSVSIYDRTILKALEKEVKLGGDGSLVREYDEFARSVTDFGDACELFGMAKMSGHPVVDPALSAASVREEGCSHAGICPLAAVRQERMFKHIVLSGYIERHGVWPPLRVPPSPGTVLRRHMNNAVTTLPMSSYPSSDLDGMMFGKFMEFDYKPDYTEFLDDKAISPGISKSAGFWFSGEGAGSTRRLLEEIITRRDFDMHETVERMRHGRFHPDELIIELTQKERELKEFARCFCKLPFAVRSFFVLTEYNLGEFMDLYMPQQTMTMNNAREKKRLYDLVSDTKAQSNVLLEVDFARWNLRWRRETVNPIARILETIYDLEGVFTHAHPFFKSCTVVLTDKHSLPAGAIPGRPISEWPEGPLLWRNRHGGGFEGIQQKLWTICTIAMMYMCFHDQNVAFRMAGQGDNQVFAMSFACDPKDVAPELVKILSVMEIRCQQLNQDVKPEECLDSSTVLTYGKEIYVRGAHLQYALKFASRAFMKDDYSVPSLSKEISGITAASMSVADGIRDTIRACWFRNFHVIRLFRSRLTNDIFSREHKIIRSLLEDPNRLRFALLLPGSLGGLPVQPWTRYFMRGETDDVSWDAAGWIRLARDNPVFKVDIRNMLQGSFTPGRPDPKKLIQDPHALPITRPSDMTELIKNAIKKRLPGQTKNRALSAIFSTHVEEYETALTGLLSVTRPFFPEICADVVTASPVGVRDKLLGRFVMTRTIGRVVGAENFAGIIERASVTLLETVSRRYDFALKTNGGGGEIQPFEFVRRMREKWGIGVIDNANIGVYTPFDFDLGYDDGRTPMVFACTWAPTGACTSSVGAYPPNFGTRTKVKQSSHGYRIHDDSSVMRDLKSLVRIASETGGSPILRDLLDRIIRTRCPWDYDTLAVILPTVFGGTAVHRHTRINSAPFSVLGSRTVPTHMNFCSDRSGILSGGMHDYPVVFQALYLTLTSVYQQLGWKSRISGRVRFGFIIPEKLDSIVDDPVTIDLPAESIARAYTTLSRASQVLVNNPLAYVSAIIASEIPSVPTKQQAKLLTEPSSAINNMYSLLVHRYHARSRQIALGTARPITEAVIDMKEFACAGIANTIDAFALASSSLAIASNVRAWAHKGTGFFSDNLSKACTLLADPLASLLCHYNYRDSNESKIVDAVLRPGRAGGESARDSVSRCLYRTAVRQIETGDAIERLVLTLNQESFRVAVSITGCYLLLKILPLYFTKANGIALDSRILTELYAGAAICQNAPSITTILDTRINSMNRLRARHTRIASVKANYEYVPMSLDEMIRCMRSLRPPRVLKAIPSSSSRVLGANIRTPTFRRLPRIAGDCQPRCKCVSTPLALRQNLLVLASERTCGRYSSLLGEMEYIMQDFVPNLAPRARVLSVGVGHGAVARVFLERKALVHGLDLVDSFPKMQQREGTYVPPEVAISGHADQFAWHSDVSRHGGNVLNLTDKPHYDVCVIDLDATAQASVNILGLFDECEIVILRTRACRHWMQFINTIPACTKMVRVTASPNVDTEMIWCKFDARLGMSGGNYKACELVNKGSCRITHTSAKNDVVGRIDDWLREPAVVTDYFGATELSRIEKQLKSLAFHSCSREEINKRLRKKWLLSEIRGCVTFRSPPTDTTLLKLTPGEVRAMGAILAINMVNVRIRYGWP